MIIETINGPQNLKNLSINDLNILSSEIRETLIKKMSKCGGHMASNLGVVEITLALHTVFNSPIDKIIFDVSHQSYVHKILTGRKDAFLYEEKYDDVSGYSNPEESVHDFFNIGHTSTSISLACGMAKARDLKGEKENIIAVIGDASLDGGESFEALNYAVELGTGLIVVVNDNDMSIPENHGALNRLLNELRDNNGVVENNYFKSLGFEYILVRDGHDLDALIGAFEKVKGTNHPVVVHCCTQKGKGYIFAEKDREKWHWARPFLIETGEYYGGVPAENYGAIVAQFLLEKINNDSDVVVVTASTPLCIGFNAENRKKAGKQFIDVGIAEQNALSMTAAIARRGGKPVFATNSTFYQRAYDQIEQEMCISKCPATMIVTHASVYGHTNDTHAGLYDMTLMANIPNLIYLAPANKEEYLAMLDWSIDQTLAPVAIRVPWTGVHHVQREIPKDYSITKYDTVVKGSKVAIIALGGFFQLGENVVKKLYKETGVSATLINPRFITGIDKSTLDGLKSEHILVVTLEDGIINGGFGSKIAQYYAADDMKVLNKGFSMNIPNRYVPSEWMSENRLHTDQIVEDIKNILCKKYRGNYLNNS
ncbi:MAG: 1-deoxy-D-xylulose-5-phosphate synthase [Lachnospiraceae bacterium]|nr:1-deoxy-D-xylulose-5-phosphate synthase [Lachnospiraceae bacterium]